MPSSWGNLPVSPDPFHLSADADELLRSWLAAVLATPGLTAISDADEARRMLLEDSLRGVEVVRELEGPIVDVGSGGGAPGIPLAAALPDREVTLLEAEGRKADFLRRWEASLPNLSVVWGRAEEQETDWFRCRGRKGAGAPARGRRVVPAAGPRRRRCRALGRSRASTSSALLESRSSWLAVSPRIAMACS